MNEIIPLVFQVQLYDVDESTNTNFTNGRARIFYKGCNRNGSFISDEFAKQLIATAVGCPVVGLWDAEKQDFTDHTKDEKKRAYGYVPQEPNFAWEKHTDEDGVEREYACMDIVLWTAMFEEAKNIITAPLSMELNPNTICGAWYTMQGKQYFMFSSGEMLGFCALGKDVEPCFEGAAFFSLQDVSFIEALREQILLEFSKGEVMDKTEIIEEVQSEPEVIVENELVEEPETVEVEEAPAEEFYKETTTTKSERTTVVEDNNGKSQTFVETEDSVRTWEVKEEEYKLQIANLEHELAEVKAENETLSSYKVEKEKAEKEAVVSEYEEVLTAEDIAEIDVNEYTVDALSDKLAAMAYKKMAKKQTADFQLVNTNLESSDDIGAIVKKYKKEI